MNHFSGAQTAICPTCGEPYLKDADFKVQCVDCYLGRIGKRRRSATPEPVQAKAAEPSIPADMLRRLIQLAHPDKHGNSEAATLATQWLLSMKVSNHA